MRKVREVLRLLWDQQRSVREVAIACDLARSTVQEYERRARNAGLAWPLPEVADSVLDSMLFPASKVEPGREAEPDWAVVANELAARKNVTRRILWEEYRAKQPAGYAYSRYCELFAAWRSWQEPSMRVLHVLRGGHVDVLISDDHAIEAVLALDADAPDRRPRRA